MSTHNIGFYEEMAKFTFQLSSNTHFSCSSEDVPFLPSRISPTPMSPVSNLPTPFLYPPQTVFVGGYTVFTLSERPTDRLCVRNILFL